ncbi:MAG TPA: NAD(P)-binding domain-containing protein, partial [Solirubrobacteraceae bacterium]|nr:NAD(P)-binding domain-containing protein [Solirubrobacteraceae bacterium]
MPATTDTLIVGAGQAGLALSRRLAAAGVDHVLLERGRVGERWRSERWDALRLLTPSWLNVLPGATVDGDPDGFAGARAFAGRLDAYARSFGAPVAERAAVRALEPARGGYRARTTAGAWRARTVVIATGDSDVPRIPAAARDAPRGLRQVAAAAYRSPAALPPGGVL